MGSGMWNYGSLLVFTGVVRWVRVELCWGAVSGRVSYLFQ